MPFVTPHATNPTGQTALTAILEFRIQRRHGDTMALITTTNIWHNGQLIPWENANIHVMSHVIHYGSSVFEGIRCYQQPEGAGVFRLHEHMQRLLHSAKIYRMPLQYSVEELNTA